MKLSIEILETVGRLKSWRRDLSGQRVGFVPTMGALHEGHAELVRSSIKECDQTIVSIFVNPAQFAQDEDLDLYPKTIEADLKLLQGLGVSAVFFPDKEEMYPNGFTTYVHEEKLSQPLCGQFRDGHFRGVTTICLKLFNLVEPTVSYFGLKDAQQFLVIRKMVKDLNLNMEVKGVRNVREADGLAMSSRNRYLSPENREKAPMIFSQLDKIKSGLRSGESFDLLRSSAQTSLEEVGFRVQYLELLDTLRLDSVGKIAPGESQEVLLAIAAHLGETRLIDNLMFRLPL